jgi:FMN phosphatase YigB (HAD superfamily)
MTALSIGGFRRAQTRRACSFDVFDTFLLRACTTPTGVFERTYQLSGISEDDRNMSDHFCQHRILAESRARAKAKQTRGSAEVNIAEIYSCFPFKLFGLDDSAVDQLVDAEFGAELDLCRTNPEILAQYLDNKRAGHRVGFISDTYWDAARLGQLLRACCPDLAWDFLYASCDHRSSKSEALFAAYVAEQQVDVASALHVGDNPQADIEGARRFGIRARHYPQAGARLASRLQREASLFDLLCDGHPRQLDHGARTLRRMVAARSAEQSPAYHLGVTVVGPVMRAFDAFVADRVAKLDQDGRRVGVAFLGRDGFLSYQVWQRTREAPACYLEVNRRVSLIASADTMAPLCELFRKIPKIDAPTFGDMLKVVPARIAGFFADQPGGIATGADLADALPMLMQPRDVADLAAGLRTRLVGYLRETIADFDALTDLVLIDIGYSGNVQKALSRALRLEANALRLHGLYLFALDDALEDLAEGDSAEGFICDRTVTPHVNRMLVRNALILEQICCSPEGSVRDYQDGGVVREPNLRPPAQIARCAEIQAGALAFMAVADAVAADYSLAPYDDLVRSAAWSAATIGRLLLLPDDEELALFGDFQHDVNLGTATLAPMIDAGFIRNQIVARGLSAACTTAPPPMWIAGSFAALSPALAYSYALFGANRLSADVVGETPCGSLQVGLFRTGGTATLETVTVFLTGLGDLRVRVPVSRQMGLATIALPLGKLTREGLLDGVVLQQGKTIAEAAHSQEVVSVPAGLLIDAGLRRSGRHYLAEQDDACLLIQLGPMRSPFAIYTLAVTPLGRGRPLATQPAAILARGADEHGRA